MRCLVPDASVTRPFPGRLRGPFRHLPAAPGPFPVEAAAAQPSPVPVGPNSERLNLSA